MHHLTTRADAAADTSTDPVKTGSRPLFPPGPHCPPWCDPHQHDVVNGEHAGTRTLTVPRGDIVLAAYRAPGEEPRFGLNVAEDGGVEVAGVELTLAEAYVFAEQFVALLKAARSR